MFSSGIDKRKEKKKNQNISNFTSSSIHLLNPYRKARPDIWL